MKSKFTLKNKKVVAIVAAVVFVFLYLFFEVPNLSPLYSDGAFLWCVVISVVTGVLILKDVLKLRLQDEGNGKVKVVNASGSKLPKVRIAIVLIPWILYFLVFVISTPLFNSAAYKNQLTEPEERVFSSDIQAIDVRSVPIVDVNLASRIADKKLGEKPSLGSQVVLGEPVIQTVDGELVWVVPLLHSGFFKWLSNTEGTPGYIIVSATNTSDVTYVEDFNIKYQPNAYLFDDLERKIRFSGMFFTGITDYSFELDDTGRPYWVATTYNNSWGFSLPEATGVLLLDAGTGEAQWYNVDEVPEWVDRVQPEEFIMNQVNNMGNYIHGVFNFSNLEKFQTSAGSIIVYNEGKCYLFTGLTSVGSDESAIGFMMVDMVTKQPYRYQISGATEYSAQKSAEGKVQHLDYYASYPLILNVDGQPTYFMTLKDYEGLIKQYAFVSVTDYLVVGVGDTVSTALRDYEVALRDTGGGLGIDSGVEVEVTGEALRFSSEYNGAVTNYRIIIEGYESVIFEAAFDISPELSITREGDTVSVIYYETDDTLIDIIKFDNEEFTN